MTVRTELTETEAMAAYRAICAELGRPAADHPVRQGEGDPAWYTGPVLCRDFEGWHSTTAWAVVWEGGHDWAYALSTRLINDGPVPGVGVDAYNSFALSLYPEQAR